MYATLFLLALLPPWTALAAPLFGLPSISSILSGQGNNSTSDAAPTPVSNATISSTFIRPIQFSQLAYCSSPQVLAANSSSQLQKLFPGLHLFQTGGDDGEIPMYFVAHDPQTDAVVLAHQGTNSDNILSILNDVQFGLVPLNASRFAGMDVGNASVHDGFQKTFERTADGVKSGVLNALKSTGAPNLLVTGHSLGAAIATMGAMLLKPALPAGVAMNTVVFGLPRGGNQAWADLVNTQIGANLTHITNQHDPVPDLPPRFLSFVQPQGEVHINAVDGAGNATDVVACPGQENDHCSEGNSVLQASVANHIGPYFQNITLHGAGCPLGAN